MRSEDASTTLSDKPARFVWMMGCVLQDACDNMRVILIFKLKLRVARCNGGEGSGASGKSVGLLRTDKGLGAERRWL
jgi:hypothetical protein